MQTSKQTYIIEHLEPELFPWCIIEYTNISRIAGKNNIWFTNIKKQNTTKLNKYGRVFSNSINHLINEDNCCQNEKNSSVINNKDICILDPEAKKELKPEEAKKFSYFIFGGILGDFPPRKRTQPELSIFFPQASKRNIGKEQFSTDNAVFVTKEIVKGKKLKDLKFQQDLEIKTGKYDSVILPYLYPIINNKPHISKELVRYIKKHQGF